MTYPNPYSRANRVFKSAKCRSSHSVMDSGCILLTISYHDTRFHSHIWGFWGGEYEECRLLGYNNPVRTSQETQYVSATESSRLMLYKIWDFYGGDYEEYRFLGYKNPVHTSQETYYFSVTQPRRLMLRKIWGFRGGDYEESCLLRYKDPVHTSQETHYVSATELSRLMLSNIWGFHRFDYDECGLLWCHDVWLLLEAMFRTNVLPPSSGWKVSAI
jgi:hypothetical protein